MIEKIKKTYKESIYALNFPYGIDKQWDDECDRSLDKTLDIVYYSLLTFVVGIPFTSLTVLIVQNYGK